MVKEDTINMDVPCTVAVSVFSSHLLGSFLTSTSSVHGTLEAEGTQVPPRRPHPDHQNKTYNIHTA